jgi:hypothetical protein
MEGIILIPAVYRGSRDLVDKTKNLTFQTNEITPDQAGKLQGCVQEFVYLAIKREDFSKSEVDLINDLKTDFQDVTKSPAQRLRAVFYRLWQQNSGGYTDFNLYYMHEIETLINHFKNLLL